MRYEKDTQSSSHGQRTSMEPALLALAMTSLKTNVRYSFVFFDWGRSVSVMQCENEAPVDSGVLERQTRQVLTHEGCPTTL